MLLFELFAEIVKGIVILFAILTGITMITVTIMLVCAFREDEDENSLPRR